MMINPDDYRGFIDTQNESFYCLSNNICLRMLEKEHGRTISIYSPVMYRSLKEASEKLPS